MVVSSQIVTPNLYDLIFKTILKLPNCTGPLNSFWSNWGCVMGYSQGFSHDFIISLLLPHIVLLILLYGIVRSLSHEHGGLSTLLGLGIYIFIIYVGWYPIFAKLTLFWLVVTIIFSTYMFIVGKIFPPTKAEQLSAVFKSSKQRRAIQQQIATIEYELRHKDLTSEERKMLQQELHQLRKALAGLS